MGWMGWMDGLSYTAVTPRASLQSDANNKYNIYNQVTLSVDPLPYSQGLTFIIFFSQMHVVRPMEVDTTPYPTPLQTVWL